jgi:hypothetical protein
MRPRGFAKENLMKKMQLIAGIGLLMAAGGAASAADPWTVVGPFRVASASGGPWTLAQAASPTHAATLANPLDGFCDGASVSPHNGTDLMQPYYFPLTFGSERRLTGFFDYRVKDHEEMVAYGTSRDGGKTWRILGTALQLNDGRCGSAGLTDSGQGHAAVVEVDGVRHLYTLDRAATPSFLLEHVLGDGRNPLAVLPADEPVSGNVVPTTAPS